MRARDLGRAAVHGASGLVVVYLFAIVAAAIVFTWAEGRPLGDSVWWACVTAMTIGYGDIYPVTTAGRVAAVALMHFVPLVVIPVVTARIAARLIVDSDAFTHTEQEEIKLSLRRIEERLRNE